MIFFLAWQCPHCYRWGVAMPSSNVPSKINLKCTACGKTTKLKKKNQFGLSAQCKMYDSGKEAALAVAQKNMEQEKK